MVDALSGLIYNAKVGIEYMCFKTAYRIASSAQAVLLAIAPLVIAVILIPSGPAAFALHQLEHHHDHSAADGVHFDEVSGHSGACAVVAVDDAHDCSICHHLAAASQYFVDAALSSCVSLAIDRQFPSIDVSGEIRSLLLPETRAPPAFV